MRQIACFVLGVSLLGIPACAEQPGKKDDKKAEKKSDDKGEKKADENKDEPEAPAGEAPAE
jgi:hypothetical protein